MEGTEKELLLVYDIIIVGAGPAGLSTGLHLERIDADLAKRTLILDKARHPRPKLCAGGVLPGADACLRRLGLDPSDVPSTPVTRIELRFYDRVSAIQRTPITFRTVRREQFDAWLADAARRRNLEIQEEVQVTGIHAAADLVEVYTNRGNYQARVVVGADGSGSIVRRSVPNDRQISNIARLVEIYQTGEQLSTTAIFDFSYIFQGAQGYFWRFPSPSPEHPANSWGVFDSRLFSSQSHGSLKHILDQGLEQHNGSINPYQIEGHPLRWYHPKSAIAAPRILLAGDAAGTDPVVGEGISFALGYGEVAALSLKDAFDRNDFSFSDYNRRLHRHRTGRYLRRRFMAAQLLYGIRLAPLYRLVWPLLGWVAENFFIDWSYEK